MEKSQKPSKPAVAMVVSTFMTQGRRAILVCIKWFLWDKIREGWHLNLVVNRGIEGGGEKQDRISEYIQPIHLIIVIIYVTCTARQRLGEHIS
jgi:hypothetical protein